METDIVVHGARIVVTNAGYGDQSALTFFALAVAATLRAHRVTLEEFTAVLEKTGR